MLASFRPQLLGPAGLRGVRNIAFTSSVTRAGGSRARGLKRDPDEYMVSPAGVRYPGTPETLEPVRRLLGAYALPDALMLQAVTHKSFAHGKVPYSEKLAILGQQLFRLQAWRSVASAPVEAATTAAENGNNFDVDQQALELLTSTPVLASLCDKAGLESAMFYKQPSDKTAPTIKARTMHALVGAVLLQRGAADAMKFINERLLAGDLSVFDVADKLYVHTPGSGSPSA